MKIITINELADVVADLNEKMYECEFEGVILVPFQLHTDGNYIGIDFFQHTVWDNEDNNCRNDRPDGHDINDVKQHIYQEMSAIFGCLKQFDPDKITEKVTG